MNLPFYISWSKQDNPSTFHVSSVDGVRIVTDEFGEIYDMSSISYQAHFGHNNSKISDKMISQLKKIPMSSPKAIIPGKIEVTRRLLDYMQLPNGKIFYTTGGAESVENALKIARDFTKKKIVLARKNSYHGATLGALTVTGDWRNPAHLTPQDWVKRIPEPDEVDALKKTREIILETGPQNIAAIILETITGGNGVYTGTQKWWDEIKKLCVEFNILLILDEVVCGFERTGKEFGYMHFNISPDMVCLAKGISGGMFPFGAVWTSDNISQFYNNNVLCCGLTNYAHPLGLAALEGVLDIVYDQKFKENLKKIEQTFLNSLNKFKELSIVKEIRVHGMLSAVDLNKNIDLGEFLKNGIYLVSQNKRIILAPPLIFKEDELEEAMKRIYKILKGHQ